MTDTLFKKDFSKESVSKRLLSFVARYRIANPSCVARCFYRDKPHGVGVELARDQLEALRQSQLVTRVKGNSVFAKDTYVHAGSQPQEDYDLARLWYCTQSTPAKQLLTYSELKELFAAENQKPPHQNYSFAVSPESGGDALFRIYQCKAKTMKNFRTQLGKILSKDSQSYRNWLDDGTLGVAILVHTESKAADIRQVLDEPVRGKLPFNATARITVSVVPDHDGYRAAVKGLLSASPAGAPDE